MDSCFTCKYKDGCETQIKLGNIIGCIEWKPVDNLN